MVAPLNKIMGKPMAHTITLHFKRVVQPTSSKTKGCQETLGIRVNVLIRVTMNLKSMTRIFDGMGFAGAGGGWRVNWG
jgi:hypothetical protein